MLMTYMTLATQFLGAAICTSENGLETDGWEDHRNSGTWGSFENLMDFANVVFKGMHDEMKSELWSKLSVLIPAPRCTLDKSLNPSELRFTHL